ncbi:GNAT family N-acetyltransferase [Roseibium polysiphoniae]|uniref:GNAT family N-acetyltransferase n=1 Tax=Roseibium polysiphoniae TaxID=2571221 RepID=A0ABR9CFH6_9HYPH|nr:GNAT family N-acetyltransferase [Roseibium polysiphoniae]MBD8878634.1 GNAT family N-acetyltransferase [Roseibium polysiphoniae]
MSYWWSRPEPPVVEEVVDEDLPQLAEIHSASFGHGWGEEELARLLGQSGVFALVIRRANPFGTRKPMGFILIRSVAGEAEILTIAVDPKCRGRGLAGSLLHQAMFRLYGDRCECLFLEVDAANEAALRLYKGRGFRKVGERKGYYRSGDGDGTALVMRVDLL